MVFKWVIISIYLVLLLIYFVIIPYAIIDGSYIINKIFGGLKCLLEKSSIVL